MNNTLSLQELFNNRIFQVPDYQRGYSWEQQQVAEFLDDLEVLTSARHHYTGTIVLSPPAEPKTKEDEEGTIYDERDVVDGQQRLTTIVLLLNEISIALSAYGGSKALAQGVRKNYVKSKSSDHQPLHKLSLNKDTDWFFRDRVLSDAPIAAGPPNAAAKRLLDTKNQIAKYLQSTVGDAPSREQWLRDLQRKVTTRLHFNLYEVEHRADVGVIFEVMNDRGKQLTNLEKVKNYLLYTASTLDVRPRTKDELTDSVNDAWTDILERLMAAGLSSPADEDQLLRAHWLMQYDPQSRNWDGSKSIKERFNLRRYHGQSKELLDELSQYITGLRNACVYFCDARKPNRSGAFEAFSSDGANQSEVKRWNSSLMSMRVEATFLPLLMAVRTRWSSEPQKYLEIVQICERFAFRFYQMARYYSNFRQSHMFHLAHEAYTGAEFDALVPRIKQIYNYEDERSNFDEFIDARTPRNWYGRKGLKYFLYEYEQHMAYGKGASPKASWDEVNSRDLKDTVEHILPQSIDGRLCWRTHFDKGTHEAYVHDIGNLTLTKHNSHYGNKCFSDKKGVLGQDDPCYSESPFFQEQELAQYNDWGVDAIDERRAKLLSWAEERWRVDFSDSGLEGLETDDEDYDAGGE